MNIKHIFLFAIIFGLVFAQAVEPVNEGPADDSVEPEDGPGDGGVKVDLDRAKPLLLDAHTPAVRSLLQACHKEIAKLCPKKKAMVKCLADNAAAITDATCKRWVSSRETCMAAAKKHATCTTKDSPRQCLRKVPEKDLPSECTDSDFYKSVKMFAMFRRNPSKKIFGGLFGGKS